MDTTLLMAELIQQYGAVYSERQRLMKAIRAHKYVSKDEYAEWYQMMEAECIIPESTAFHYYFACRDDSGGCFRQKPTQYFRSAASKRAAIARQVKWNAEYEEYHSNFSESSRTVNYYSEMKQRAAELAKLHLKQVHPHAKAIRAYGKMLDKMKVLNGKKQRLKNTICQLSKMELGVKVGWGVLAYHACDRITSITVGDRVMKTKEFLELMEFESAVFGE